MPKTYTPEEKAAMVARVDAYRDKHRAALPEALRVCKVSSHCYYGYTADNRKTPAKKEPPPAPETEPLPRWVHEDWRLLRMETLKGLAKLRGWPLSRFAFPRIESAGPVSRVDRTKRARSRG